MEEKDDDLSCTCEICMIAYSENNKALILKCGHSLCEHCLKRLKEKICPSCKKDFKGESTPINFQLMEIVNFLEKSKVTVIDKNSCYNHKKEDRNFCCYDCFKFTCTKCLSDHLDKRHKINKVKSEDMEIVQNYKKFYDQIINSKFKNNIKLQKEQFINDIKITFKEIDKEKESIEKKFDETVQILKIEKDKAIDFLNILQKELNEFGNYLLIFEETLFNIISTSHPLIETLSKKDRENDSNLIKLLKFVEEDKDNIIKIIDIFKHFSESDFGLFKLNSSGEKLINYLDNSLQKAFYNIKSLIKKSRPCVYEEYQKCFNLKHLQIKYLDSINLNSLCSELDFAFEEIYLFINRKLK